MADEIIDEIAIDILVAAKLVRVFLTNNLYTGLRKSEGFGVDVVHINGIGPENRKWHRSIGAKIDAVGITARLDVDVYSESESFAFACAARAVDGLNFRC